MAQEEGAGEVGVQDEVPFLGGVRLRLLAHVGAGVVDQDVEPAELGDRLSDRATARGLVGHIEHDECRLGAELAQFGERRIRFGPVARRQDDRPPLIGAEDGFICRSERGRCLLREKTEYWQTLRSFGTRQRGSKLPGQLDADERRQVRIVPRVRNARAGDNVVGITAPDSRALGDRGRVHSRKARL